MSKDSGAAKKFALGALIAGAAGYLVGVLTAPSDGKKTRQQLKDTASSGMGEAEKQLKKLHTELGDMVGMAKEKGDNLSGRGQKKFGEALDGAKTAKDKLREVLSSLHEGEANDRDLKKALDEAKRSLEHLKQYIKK